LPQGRGWIVLQAALLIVVLGAFANLGALSARVGETIQDMEAGRGRTGIWRDAIRLADAFPLTGSGAGTFGHAVLPYQTALPDFYLGNAHNHYLQIVAEGGALLVIPAAFVVGSFLFAFCRRLHDDTSSTYFLRAGAGAGIVAVLIQSIWETGLRMPANAMLCAVLAAVAVHTPSLTPAVKPRIL
jgi:O-antigen ligase